MKLFARVVWFSTDVPGAPFEFDEGTTVEAVLAYIKAAVKENPIVLAPGSRISLYTTEGSASRELCKVSLRKGEIMVDWVKGGDGRLYAAGAPDYAYYDARPEGFEVFSWSPTPQAEVDVGKVQAPSTQVHLMALVGPIKAVWRFKGPGTLDALIAALIKHREDVWGKP